MIQRIARRLGYVPQQQFDVTVAKLKETRDRLERTTRSLDRATAAAGQGRLAAEQLKQRCGAAEKAAAVAREDAKRAEARLVTMGAERDRRIAEIRDELKAQMAKRLAALEAKAAANARAAETTIQEWEDMERRVAAAAEDLKAVGDHLMAVEVKLDIVEGAANVLDRRLRARPASAPAS